MFVVSYFSTYLRSRMSNFKPGHTKVILQKWTNRCNKFVSNLIIPNRGRRGNRRWAWNTYELMTTQKGHSSINNNVGRLLVNCPLTYNSWVFVRRTQKSKLHTTSIPIRVLTRTKSSCSDDRLPLGYLLPDFQQIWRNFLKSLHFFTTRFCNFKSL